MIPVPDQSYLTESYVYDQILKVTSNATIVVTKSYQGLIFSLNQAKMLFLF